MLHIGCSGWQYGHWEGRFYPRGMPTREWLGYYAKRFPSVEVNATFYGSMKPKTFDRWYRATPERFTFTLKGSRFVTHIRRIRDVEGPVRKFYEGASGLGEKLACVLWQLPPSLSKDLGKLGRFCDLLPERPYSAIEFRHESWFDGETTELLREKNVAFCCVSFPEMPELFALTSPALYARFHGKESMYGSLYTKPQLRKWAERIKRAHARDVFCYFNNDDNAHAVRNAKTMLELLR